MISPPPVGHETAVVEHAAAADAESPAALVARIVDEQEVGVPPGTATAVHSSPSAGQRRAVTRALRELEETPPGDVAADPELAAHLSEKIREHFLSLQGEEP